MKGGEDMVETSCRAIVNKMMDNEIINSDEFDIYLYNLQIIVESLIIHVMLFIFATAIGHLFELLLFIIVFDGIRQFSSGFHCETTIGCVILSFFTCTAMFLIEKLVIDNWSIYQGGVIISIIFIIINGAINHPNMGWSEQELFKAKRNSRIVTVFFTSLILMLGLLSVDKTYIYYLDMGINVSAISMMVEQIKVRGGKGHEEF